MRPLYVIIILCLTSTLACSKLTYEEVAGTYIYKNNFIHETLVLKSDSTFYYKHNAHMTGGETKGKYTITDGRLVLDDGFNPETRAIVNEQYSDRIKGVKIKVKDANDSVVPFALILIYRTNKTDSLYTDKDGLINSVSDSKVDSISFKAISHYDFSYVIKEPKTNYIEITVSVYWQPLFNNELWRVKKRHLKPELRNWKYSKQ